MRIPFNNRLESLRFHTFLAIGLLAALIGLPVAAFIGTHHQFVRFGERIALGYARNVIARSNRISAEFRAELPVLAAAQGNDPCSQKNIALMQSIAMKYIDIIFVGYEQDDRLLCSSFGLHPNGVVLGPVTFTGQYKMRRNVRVDVAPSTPLNAVEWNGWVFFIAPLQSIDVAAPDKVALATYSTLAKQLRTSNGFIRPEWVLRGQSGQEVSFADDGYAVGMVESDIYPSGAIAAVPLSALQPDEQLVESVAVGAAALAGLSIAAWILHIARQYRVISAVTLKNALRHNEFYMVYQPIVDLKTRRWVGAEALMRWRRANIEISPDLFFSAAETMGLMDRFTERALSLITDDARVIFPANKTFYLSFNLAASDVKDVAIVARLRKLAEDCGVSPARFQAEITERSVLDEVAARGVIGSICEIGMSTVVDDFGTGFSNLKYLSMFQFDGLKIDRAFVGGIGSGSVTGEVAFHIIALAKSLNMVLTAEGVENEEQAGILQARGVQYAQGWLFAKPKNLTDLVAGIKAGKVGSAAYEWRSIFIGAPPEVPAEFQTKTD